MSRVVTGNFRNIEGRPLQGKVWFRPSIAIEHTGGSVCLPAPTSAEIDKLTGDFSITLECTDDPAWSPSGWVMMVEEQITGGRTFSALIPSGVGSLNYTDLTVAEDPAAYEVYVPLSQRGAANGVATLDSGGTVPVAQIPAAYALATDLTAHEADTTAVHGIVNTANLVLTDDSRLTDARTPTAHAASHAAAGGDALRLDELAAPTASVALGSQKITGLADGVASSDAATVGQLGSAGIPATTFDANTILKADSDDTPAALTVDASTIVGRKATGGIAALTGAEVAALLSGISPAAYGNSYRAVASSDSITSADQIVDATATATLTMPAASSVTGRVFCLRNSGTGTMTVARTGADTFDGATSIAMAGKGHVELASTGSGWRVLSGQYESDAVGRCVYNWDRVNNRWQLVYGDTGWRRVDDEWRTALAASAVAADFGWASLITYIRRVNWTVYLWIYDYYNTVKTSGSSTVPAVIASGFRPPSWARLQHVAARTVGGTICGSIELSSSGGWTHYFTATSANGGYTSNWSTAGAWPTTLPGTAYGSIPT